MLLDTDESIINPGSAFSLFFVLEALREDGRNAEALKLLRDKYKFMLDKGATTWWETFPGYEPHCPGWWTRSHCHGWSSGATYFLSKEVLGVKPLSAGMGKVLIAPEPFDLQWAKGSFPTPHGVIRVQWEKKDGTFKIKVEAPEACGCEVQTPEGSGSPSVELKYY